MYQRRADRRRSNARRRFTRCFRSRNGRDAVGRGDGGTAVAARQAGRIRRTHIHVRWPCERDIDRGGRSGPRWRKTLAALDAAGKPHIWDVMSWRETHVLATDGARRNRSTSPSTASSSRPGPAGCCVSGMSRPDAKPVVPPAPATHPREPSRHRTASSWPCRRAMRVTRVSPSPTPRPGRLKCGTWRPASNGTHCRPLITSEASRGHPTASRSMSSPGRPTSYRAGRRDGQTNVGARTEKWFRRCAARCVGRRPRANGVQHGPHFPLGRGHGPRAADAGGPRRLGPAHRVPRRRPRRRHDILRRHPPPLERGHGQTPWHGDRVAGGGPRSAGRPRRPAAPRLPGRRPRMRRCAAGVRRPRTRPVVARAVGRGGVLARRRPARLRGPRRQVRPSATPKRGAGLVGRAVGRRSSASPSSRSPPTAG